MRIAVLKETDPGERRVALVPESCRKLITAGYEISIETAAGDAAGYRDDDDLPGFPHAASESRARHVRRRTAGAGAQRRHIEERGSTPLTVEAPS